MEAMRAGEALFNAVVHLAASMAAMCLSSVESLCFFVLSDDFTAGYLIILLFNFVLGQQYKDAMSIDLTKQMEPLEKVLDEEFKAREEERCRPSSRVTTTMISASGQCSICLQEFEEGQRGELMPECHHLFHHVCIDQWLINHTSCPLCRSRVF